jgi:hypothetical protein
MTTYEFLTAVVERDIEEQLYNRMKKFLEFSDLVKFAKLVPELEKMNGDLEEAIAMVDYIRQTELTRYAIPSPTEPAPPAPPAAPTENTGGDNV